MSACAPLAKGFSHNDGKLGYFNIYNKSHLFFSTAELLAIISFVSDKVDDQILWLEITGSWEVEAKTQDGKHTFQLTDIFPK